MNMLCIRLIKFQQQSDNPPSTTAAWFSSVRYDIIALPIILGAAAKIFKLKWTTSRDHQPIQTASARTF